MSDNFDYDKFWFALFTIGEIVGLFFLGWFANDGWRMYWETPSIKGMWINWVATEEEAVARAESREPVGRWICVNVVESMSFESIVETCSHEAGHELFAKKCALHPEVCFELEKTLENKTQ